MAKNELGWSKWEYIMIGVVVGFLIFTILLKLGIIQYCNFDYVIPKDWC